MFKNRSREKYTFCGILTGPPWEKICRKAITKGDQTKYFLKKAFPGANTEMLPDP